MLYPCNRSSLAEKIRAYDTVRNRFGFFNHLEDLSISELHTAAEKLIKIYQDDLEVSLGNELVQFVAFKKDYNVNSEPKEMFFIESWLIIISALLLKSH
jgi:hypothetical protein